MFSIFRSSDIGEANRALLYMMNLLYKAGRISTTGDIHDFDITKKLFTDTCEDALKYVYSINYMRNFKVEDRKDIFTQLLQFVKENAERAYTFQILFY